MYVFCAGMYRSCSTWQYDVVCHLLQAGESERLGYLTGEQFADLYLQSPETDGCRVLKSHDCGPEFAQALAAGNAIALYSYRDLRDVAYSLAHKLVTTFEDVTLVRRLLHGCIAQFDFWAAQPNTLRQKYEALTHDFPTGIAQIASHLKVALTPAEAEAIAGEFSLEANRERTRNLREKLESEGVDLAEAANGGKYDATTLLHWNHIRQGKVADWRDQATPHHRMALLRICGKWLIEQGYEEDDRWASPADQRLLDLVAAGQQVREANEDRLARIDQMLAVARRRIDYAETVFPRPIGLLGRLRRRLLRAA